MPPPLKLSQIPVGSPNANTLLVGVETIGITNIDHQYTIASLIAFMNIGASPIKANADLAAQTAAVSSICAYTAPSTGTYSVGGYINATSYSSGTISLVVDFTDENGIPQTIIVQSVIALGFGVGRNVNIRAMAGTIKMSSIFSGASTYDIGATITFII